MTTALAPPLAELAVVANHEPTGIVETVSEKAERPKRGRPRATGPDMDAFLNNMMSPNTHTRRSKLNALHRNHAIYALTSDITGDVGKLFDDRVKWVFDPKACNAGDLHGWRMTILTELGRIDDGPTIRSYALQIAKLKPKTKTAVAAIRKLRNSGRQPQGTVDGLTERLCDAIDIYRMEHAGVNGCMVFEALRYTTRAVEYCETDNAAACAAEA